MLSSDPHRSVRALLTALVVAVVVVVALVAVGLATSGGDDQAGGGARTPDLGAAARAANCEVRELPEEGAEHTTRRVTYRSNPPTSGDHAPEPAADGAYEPGNEPTPERLVHTLEHGRVILQYRPGIPERRRAELDAMFEEPVKGSPAYHTVLIQNNTGMRPEVAATSWTRAITCPRASDATLDALRAFRDRYVDQAPELVP